MKIINAEDKEVRSMLAKTSPIFKLLNEKIEEITRSPEEERFFDSRMKMRSDILGEMELNYNEGLAKGLEKGIYSKAIETAKKLISMNLSIENIAKATGLSKEEIEKL